MLDEPVREPTASEQPVTDGEMVLPGQWRDIIRNRGPLPAHPDERRRHARYWFPKAAVLELEQSLPAVSRERSRERVLLRDISRSGVAFVHRFALYPGEHVRLQMDNGLLTAAVARCRRLNATCFEIGAEFLVTPTEDAANPDGA